MGAILGTAVRGRQWASTIDRNGPGHTRELRVSSPPTSLDTAELRAKCHDETLSY